MTHKLVWAGLNDHLCHMSNITNIAVSSIRAAGVRFAAHAENIANANSTGYAALRPEQISTAAGPVVRVTRPDKSRPNAQQGDNAPAPESDVDLTREFAQLIALKYDYKASVKLLRTADEISGTLLDVLA